MASLYGDVLVGNEIRLLEVLPGNWADVLTGRLYKADTSQRYTALSYCWGCPRNGRKMEINEQVAPINLNLERALRTIRPRTESIVLWVDAICIHQDNLVEKGNQVNLMYEIYKNADRVYAYLGDSLDIEPTAAQHDKSFDRLGQIPRVEFRNDETDQPFTDRFLSGSWTHEHLSGTCSNSDLVTNLFCLLRVCASKREVEQSQIKSLLTPSGHSAQIDGCHSVAATRALFKNLRAFTDSSWWHRIWTLQESLVATQLTVFYGHLSAPFELLQDAAYIPEFLLTLQNEYQQEWDVFVMLVNALAVHRMMGIPALIPKCSARNIELLRTNSTNVPLLSLLREFRYRGSTDPRDKIFALLNIAPDFRNSVSFTLDYGMNVSHLFQQVAIYLFEGTGYFWPTYRDLFRNANSPLPSWVPDWSRNGEMDDQQKFSGASGTVLFHCASDIYYDAEQNQICLKESRDTPLVNSEGVQQHSSRPSSEQWFSWLPNGALKMSALRFDRVAYIQPLTSGEDMLSKIGRAVLSFAFNFLSHKPLDEVPYGPLPLAVVLMRVLCGGTKWKYDEAGVNPEVSILESKDDIKLFQMFVMTLGKHWRDSWLERRLNASWIYRLFGFWNSVGQPSLLTNIYGSKLDPKPFSQGIGNFKAFGIVLESVFQASGPDIALAQQFSYATEGMAQGRTLFYTEKGWIGIGPPITLVGDDVVLFQQALCPYVVRRTQHTTDEAYKLLGDCYVDGIMDGEAYDKSRLREIRLI
ncbi:hypothetical protein L207DRAFT_521628 [Hyaloscypha variabilis F]|uniref:Heterokaryon incompatibility domain-containing protein n=1 Tax=Hyaloscypha variabilis (strain UAMH 11265 / GT02V1 / F) TaxID=1149755 RepID=A0A2J6SBS5_HYAVF|nr:hypothetical protein L207DRAFT_521628 [Hyaloscypha variabilis F]